jgi:hypothetical protein
MCCGRNREAARAAIIAGGTGRNARNEAQVPVTAVSSIMFEFLGSGEMVIRGPVSARVYRFSGNGDRVRVDPRDRPGLLGLRTLRWVRYAR